MIGAIRSKEVVGLDIVHAYVPFVIRRRRLGAYIHINGFSANLEGCEALGQAIVQPVVCEREAGQRIDYVALAGRGEGAQVGDRGVGAITEARELCHDQVTYEWASIASYAQAEGLRSRTVDSDREVLAFGVRHSSRHDEVRLAFEELCPVEVSAPRLYINP